MMRIITAIFNILPLNPTFCRYGIRVQSPLGVYRGCRVFRGCEYGRLKISFSCYRILRSGFNAVIHRKKKRRGKERKEMKGKGDEGVEGVKGEEGVEGEGNESNASGER